MNIIHITDIESAHILSILTLYYGNIGKFVHDGNSTYVYLALTFIVIYSFNMSVPILFILNKMCNVLEMSQIN